MIYLQAMLYTIAIIVIMGTFFWIISLAPVKIIIGLFFLGFVWYIKLGIDVGLVPKLWGKK